MTDELPAEPSRRERRRYVARGLLRALVSTAVLVALYFLLPLAFFSAVPVAVAIVSAAALLAGITGWQVHRILHSAKPRLRGIEALAIIAPLYLLLFAATYFLMAQDDPASFSAEPLTRVDTLYFTVTVFSTVGFGDISAASEYARILVTVQMILNLIVLGAGVRLLTAAVKRGRDVQGDD